MTTHIHARSPNHPPLLELEFQYAMASPVRGENIPGTLHKHIKNILRSSLVENGSSQGGRLAIGFY